MDVNKLQNSFSRYSFSLPFQRSTITQNFSPADFRLFIYRLLYVYWLALTIFSLLFIYYLLFGFAVGIAGGEGITVTTGVGDDHGSAIPGATQDSIDDENELSDQLRAEREERKSWGGKKQEEVQDGSVTAQASENTAQNDSQEAWEGKDDGDNEHNNTKDDEQKDEKAGD